MQKNELCVNFYTHVRNTKLIGFEIYLDSGHTHSTVKDAIEALYPLFTERIVLCLYTVAAGSGVALIYKADTSAYGTSISVDAQSRAVWYGFYSAGEWIWKTLS